MQRVQETLAPATGWNTPLPGTSPPALRSYPSRDDSCCERIRETLEELDDAVFAAIGGDLSALQRARCLWPRTLVELGWDHVAESREQYLRRAAEVTRRTGTESASSPQRAMAAVEIVTLLTRY